MEVMSAIVIIAIVATAGVNGLTSLRGKANEKLDQTNIAELTSLVQTYRLETGKWPSGSMKELYQHGYAESDQFPTPYGGRYRFDRANKVVVNPRAPQRQ